MLAGEAEQALHDVMRALRLFVQFFDVVRAARIGEFFGLQQLAVTENRRKRIIEFVSYAGDELANRRHLLALEKLFLRERKALISVLRFFEEQRLVDRCGDLISHGCQEIQFRWRKLAVLAASDHQNSHDAIF